MESLTEKARRIKKREKKEDIPSMYNNTYCAISQKTRYQSREFRIESNIEYNRAN